MANEDIKKRYEHYVPPVKEDPLWFNKLTLHVVESLEELKEIFDTHEGYMAWDTETEGLNPEKHRIVGYSIAFDHKEGWYVPIRHKLGKNLDPKEALDMLYNKMLHIKMLFAFNYDFDARMMEYEGYDLSPVPYYDVRVGTFMADTNVKNGVGLKDCEKRWLGWSATHFEEALGNAENFAYTDPYGEAGQYACVTGDTLVKTECGDRRIDSIQVGDKVLSSKGFREVTGFYNQGIKRVLRVDGEFGSLRCTYNHKVAVESVLGPVFIEAQYLNKYSKLYEGNSDIRDLTEDSRDNLSNVSYSSKSWKTQSVQDMEACYYLLGLALADGNLYGNRISLHIQKQDRQILEDMNKRFYSEATIRSHNGVSPSDKTKIVEGLEMSYSSGLLREFVCFHGLEENKTGRETYRNIPDEYYRDFLRGFYDGDGSSNGYNMCFVCCESMSKQISQDLERLLGIRPLDWYQKGDNLGDLTYGRNESVKLYQFLYGNCSLFNIRKQKKALRYKDSFVKLISKEGVESYWSSVSEASRFAGVEPSALSAVKNGKRSNTRGWKCEQIGFIPIQSYKRNYGEILVKDDGCEAVYDIMVDEVHDYVLSNGLISHNCVDACGTFAVCMKTLQYYKESKMAGKALNEFIYPMMRAMNHKIPIDVDYLSKCEEETIAHLKEIEYEVMQIVGYPFKINSNKQLGDALQSIGVNTGVFTKGGQMKVDIATLETFNLKQPTPIIEKLIDYSKSFKMYNSYITTLREQAMEKEDRSLRFAFKLFLAPTLRVAAGTDKNNDFFAKINVMAIPKPHPKNWYVHPYKEGDVVPEGDEVVLNWRFSTTEKSKYMTEGTDQHLNMRSAFLPEDGRYIVGMDFCIDPEAEVELRDGSKLKIKELEGREVEIKTPLGYKKAKNFRYTGKKQKCKLKLKDGREVICSPDHKFKVVRDGNEMWVALKDMKATDYVITD